MLSALERSQRSKVGKLMKAKGNPWSGEEGRIEGLEVVIGSPEV